MTPQERFAELSGHLQALVGLSLAIRQAQKALPKSGDLFMAIDPTLSAAMDAVDKATNDVAAELRDLSGQIATGMTPADVTAVVTRLNNSATFLESVATNPSQPVTGTAPSGTTGTTGTP